MHLQVIKVIIAVVTEGIPNQNQLEQAYVELRQALSFEYLNGLKKRAEKGEEIHIVYEFVTEQMLTLENEVCFILYDRGRKLWFQPTRNLIGIITAMGERPFCLRNDVVNANQSIMKRVKYYRNNPMG